jgi:hypothetical protein
VWEAIPLWATFPKQIEASLRAHYHDCNIGQWHSGELSSRELLVLLEAMPDDSEYKLARAGYPYGVEKDWTPMRYLAARLVAETAIQASTSFDPTGLVGPVEQAVVDMKAAGEWPPEWWPEDKKAAAEELTEPHDRDAISGLIAAQLHRRS